ncbi:MAG: hypothetical protein AAFR28_15375 [Pseudomonadota bacterium]
MALTAETLTVDPFGSWSRRVARWLGPVIRSEPAGYSVKAVKEHVESGNWVLFEIRKAGRTTPVGYAVVSITAFDDGTKHWIVRYAKGDARGYSDLTCVVLPIFERMAVQTGCAAVEFWTDRAGLARKADRLGYACRHVLVKELGGGDVQ